jgi:LssY C-terminus
VKSGRSVPKFLSGGICAGWFLVLCMVQLIFCPAGLAQCNEVRSGDAAWVRLIQPISSYSSKRGDPVRAIVIEAPLCDGVELLPQGTEISGTIEKVTRVGLGIVHESASIKLRFEDLLPRGSGPVEIGARVTEIDDARESVRNGVVHGIRATDTAQGRITSRLAHLPAWNPYSSLALVAYRTAFPVFPEPEIFLPAGTDMRIEFTAATALPEMQEPVEPSDEISALDGDALNGIITSLPERTSTVSGQDADIVNVVLIGNPDQMKAAFAAAGWRKVAHTSTRSVLKEFHAFLAFKNYAEAPVSRQFLWGTTPAVTWERGLDSYAKREHLRVWRYPGPPAEGIVWVGAFTRETGAALSLLHHEFIHHIDPDLDAGREMMIRDLTLAGCLNAVRIVSQPGRARFTLNATGDWMHTDGSIAVVQLQDCANPVFQFNTAQELPAGPIRPRSKMARYLRMQILSYRSDFIRGNLFYGAFELTRMLIHARSRNLDTAAIALASSSHTMTTALSDNSSPEQEPAEAQSFAPFQMP